MRVYGYECEGCGGKFDIVKPLEKYNQEEHCPVSGTTMTRDWAGMRVFFNNTAVQEKTWEPALGKAVTRREMDAEAKSRGWQCVGNESLDKHVKPPLAQYPTFSEDDVQAISNRLRDEGQLKHEGKGITT